MSKLKLTLELKNKILKYDFKTNGMRAFGRENNIHYNTVSKYVKMLNVEYNSKVKKLTDVYKPDNDVQIIKEIIIKKPQCIKNGRRLF